jgi:hypothetical protein
MSVKEFEAEMTKMLDFMDLYRAMKLIKKFDPVLFKRRETMHNQRQKIVDKIHKMQSEDQSLTPKNCWDRLRKEQPKLFESLPEILAADSTPVESIIY